MATTTSALKAANRPVTRSIGQRTLRKEKAKKKHSSPKRRVSKACRRAKRAVEDARASSEQPKIKIEAEDTPRQTVTFPNIETAHPGPILSGVIEQPVAVYAMPSAVLYAIFDDLRAILGVATHLYGEVQEIKRISTAAQGIAHPGPMENN